MEQLEQVQPVLDPRERYREVERLRDDGTQGRGGNVVSATPNSPPSDTATSRQPPSKTAIPKGMLSSNSLAMMTPLIGPTGIWYVQVVTLITGHVAGITLAHERALTMFKKPRQAIRSQYWMLVVMVAFTCLGLWLLSQ